MIARTFCAVGASSCSCRRFCTISRTSAPSSVAVVPRAIPPRPPQIAPVSATGTAPTPATGAPIAAPPAAPVTAPAAPRPSDGRELAALRAISIDVSSGFVADAQSAFATATVVSTTPFASETALYALSISCCVAVCWRLDCLDRLSAMAAAASSSVPLPNAHAVVPSALAMSS